MFDGQLEHEPGSPVVPAGHVHALLLALPEGEVERDGQLEQVAEPTDALYLPTVQLVHGPPSGPLEPALHTHSVLPSWLCELPRQGVQAALPSESLKVFDGQLEHELEPREKPRSLLAQPARAHTRPRQSSPAGAEGWDAQEGAQGAEPWGQRDPRSWLAAPRRGCDVAAR